MTDAELRRNPRLRVAPFIASEVESLNGFQAASRWHPHQCGREPAHAPLYADETGWRCPDCAFTQSWAFVWIVDGSWRGIFERMRRLSDEAGLSRRLAMMVGFEDEAAAQTP